MTKELLQNVAIALLIVALWLGFAAVVAESLTP
jgi:hypothetical protein